MAQRLRASEGGGAVCMLNDVGNGVYCKMPTMIGFSFGSGGRIDKIKTSSKFDFLWRAKNDVTT